MTALKYGIYCEDAELKVFLNFIVYKYCKQNNLSYKLINDKEFNSLKVPNGKSDMQKKLIDVLKYGFVLRDLDLIVAGYDCDCDQLYKISHRQQIVASYNKVFDILPNFHNRFVLAVPVQAVEHWALYIKHIADNANAKKIPKYERTPRNEAKRIVYFRKKATVADRTHELELLLNSNFDIEHLSDLCFSFGDFYQKLKNYFSNA